jgi:hypothetical protein
VRASHAPKTQPARAVAGGRAHSLVFNWNYEAARFARKLRVLDLTGAGRGKPGEDFDKYDVVLTTYGTLRGEIVGLKDYPFDYAIIRFSLVDVKGPVAEPKLPWGQALTAENMRQSWRVVSVAEHPAAQSPSISQPSR